MATSLPDWHSIWQ